MLHKKPISTQLDNGHRPTILNIIPATQQLSEETEGLRVQER
jgi:hypothetical protein